MSTYRQDRRSFAAHIDDAADFQEHWNDFDHLRRIHRAGGLPDVLVVGMGLRGHPAKPAIVLQVASLARARLPLRSRSGYPLFHEEVGEIRAGPEKTGQNDGAPFKSHYDSPPGGVSIAPTKTSYAGTLGCFAKCGEKIFILSNRHVLDPALNGLSGGPGIQQQAAGDGNVSGVSVAEATVLAPLHGDLQASLNVDAGLAEIKGSYNPQILTAIDKAPYAALITPNTVPTANETVLKSGRTTGHTQQVVDLVTAQVKTLYGNGVTYTFEDCVAIKNLNPVFQAGGDSGALLTNTAYQPLGLMFAISGNASVAYANRIATVLAMLETVTNAPVEVITGTGPKTAHGLEIAPPALELAD